MIAAVFWARCNIHQQGPAEACPRCATAIEANWAQWVLLHPDTPRNQLLPAPWMLAGQWHTGEYQ